GTLRFNAKQLSIGRASVRGAGALDWINASTSLSKIQPLGNYSLAIRGQGTRATLDLTTTQGALVVSGTGAWNAGDHQVDFSGNIQPVSDAQALEPLLSQLGTDRGQGARAFVFKQKIF